MPSLGEKLLYRVGASVLGIPGSPGTTHPSGAVGNCVDCKPGTMVSILPCVSYHGMRSEEHTSELQSQSNLVCRLLLEKKKYAVPAYVSRTRSRLHDRIP